MKFELNKDEIQNLEKSYNSEILQKNIDMNKIIGVTCASTCLPCMSNRNFSFVLLDECSQQTEPSSLIPISFGCKRLICCGDPLQLPPTLTKNSPNGLGRPLFSRLSNEYKPTMLSIQYRCHPFISNICNLLFYKNKIINGINEFDRQPLFGIPTLSIFDLSNSIEILKNNSVCNTSESITTILLTKYLLKIGINPKEIGIISFYKSQVEIIKEGLINEKNKPIVDISTVDAFQGDERDFIIISTTRTQKTNFLESNERINVAISRAKRHLIFITNFKALISSEIWSNIFSFCLKPPNKIFKLDNTPTIDWNPF